MSLSLKNPGTGAPKITEFDSIPHPKEFLLHGGVPGVEYLYLLAAEQGEGQTDGWSPIAGLPFFKIKGLTCTIMARGKKIPGAQPGSVKCKFSISKQLKQALNPEAALPPEPTEPPAPEKPSLKGSLPPKVSQNPATQRA